MESNKRTSEKAQEDSPTTLDEPTSKRQRQLDYIQQLCRTGTPNQPAATASLRATPNTNIETSTPHEIGVLGQHVFDLQGVLQGYMDTRKGRRISIQGSILGHRFDKAIPIDNRTLSPPPNPLNPWPVNNNTLLTSMESQWKRQKTRLPTTKSCIICLKYIEANRPLYIQIANANPETTFIEREPLQRTCKDGTAYQCDADLTISPTTGIISTTLQHLKQKALPGTIAPHAQFPTLMKNVNTTLRGRIGLMVESYAQIYILVQVPPLSLHSNQASALMTTHDSIAYMDFLTFCAQLSASPENANISVFIVAQAEVEYLMGWITAILASNTESRMWRDIPIIETPLELLFRNLGLNPWRASELVQVLRSRKLACSTLFELTQLVDSRDSALAGLENETAAAIVKVCRGLKTQWASIGRTQL